MLSFFGFNASQVSDVLSLVIFLIIIFIMQAKDKVLLLNPIASILNYSMYECRNTDGLSFVVLSCVEIRPKQKVSVSDYGNGLYILNGEN